MSDHDASANSFVKPVVVEVGSDVTELCRRIRRSLAINHAHCPEADRVGLADQLRTPDSPARAILGEGFHSVVVFDGRNGITGSKAFDLPKFLRYISREMAQAFGLELDELEFHPEEISQILKDEMHMSLFCFVGIQHIPYEDLQRLRGFTQEGHRCLFCGNHDFGQSENDASLTSEEFELSLDDSDDEISLLDSVDSDSEIVIGGGKPRRAPDSDIKLVMDTISLSLDPDDSDDGVSLELEDSDAEIRNAEDSHAMLVMETLPFSPQVPGGDFLKSPHFDDRELKLAAMAHQAAILTARGQLAEAMEWLNEMESGCPFGGEVLAVCLGRQAEVEIARDDVEAAVRLLERQRVILERITRQSLGPAFEEQAAAVAGSLRVQAELLRKHRRLDEALECLQQESQICSQAGLAADLTRSLALQAQIRIGRKEFDESIKLLRKLENVCRLHAFHDQLMECLGQQSQILKLTGDRGLAATAVTEQIRVAQELGREDVVAVALGQRAAIYEANGDFAAAEYSYHQGEQLCRKLRLHELLARNLANQAFMLSTKMHEHEAALHIAKEAFTLARDHGFETLAGQIKRIYEGIRTQLS